MTSEKRKKLVNNRLAVFLYCDRLPARRTFSEFCTKKIKKKGVLCFQTAHSHSKSAQNNRSGALITLWLMRVKNPAFMKKNTFGIFPGNRNMACFYKKCVKTGAKNTFSVSRP